MPKVDENPELVGAADTISPSVPVAANIALKLLVFWPNTAVVWFAQADTQFAIKTITESKTKFYHAVASLPQDVAAQILDFIQAPPAGDPYEVLKEHLTTLYSQLLSEIRSSCIFSVDWRPEAISSHEQDALASSGRLQARLHPSGFVPPSSSYRGSFAPVPREDLRSSCLSSQGR